MKNAGIMALVILMILGGRHANAQYYFSDDKHYDSPISYEAGVSVNAMNCLTDIGGKKGVGKKLFKDLNVGFTQLSGGVFFSATYKSAVALRVEGTFGKIAANDNVLSGATDEAKSRFNRNLSFTSNIAEIAALIEIHPLYIINDYSGNDQAPPRYSPYLIGGIGYFSFQPQTRLVNTVIDLKPLHLEGQGFTEYPNRPNYSLSQVNIPMGGGIKYQLSSLLNLRGEFIYRKLSTDYLDDVSSNYIDPALFDKYLSPQKAITAKTLQDRQINKVAGINGKRGTPENNDGYFSFNLKLSIILGRQAISDR